jgi:periplasmic protein CpxP/Spy
MTASSTRWNRTAARLLGTGLFVALASSVMLTAEAAPGGEGHTPHRGGGMMGPMMGLHSERALDAVNATAEQRAQIKAILDATHADLKAQRDAGRSVHEQLRLAFTQPTVDARTVETLRVQMLAQHDQASKRAMQSMLEVSRVLTPEQRARLADMAARRHANMERRAAPPR